MAESIQYLEPWGAFNGIMVGTATDPAVIVAVSVAALPLNVTYTGEF